MERALRQPTRRGLFVHGNKKIFIRYNDNETVKKIMMTLAAVLCCWVTMTMFTACDINNVDNPVNPTVDPEEELADATILWYGCGGGNVDASILDDFHKFYKAKPESFDRVNVVAQYKTSLNPTAYNKNDYETVVQWADDTSKLMSEEEMENMDWKTYFFLCHPKAGESYRFAVDPKKTLRKQLLETEPYGKTNADCTNPDSLTNFINWAAKNYPAKRYILVMADHGGGYLPHADLAEATSSPQSRAQRRGLIYDDGYNRKCFSAKSFARGVRNASVRVDGIVAYLCLMNNLEFLYEVKDVTDYIAGSTYVMWGGGSALYAIADNFAAGQDTETALSNFIDANMNNWDAEFYQSTNPNNPLYYDFTLTKTSRLNDLAPVLKEFTDRLVNTYQNGTDDQRARIDLCTANAMKVDNGYPFYDMGRYIESLFYELPDVYDQTFVSSMITAFNSCIVRQCHSKYLTDHHYEVDYSVMLGCEGTYVVYNYEGNGAESKLIGAYVYYSDGKLEYYRYVDDGGDSSDGNLARYELGTTSTWPSTFANTYELTTFDKLVGWSRWMYLNPASPPAWSPSSFNFVFPEDNAIDLL